MVVNHDTTQHHTAFAREARYQPIELCHTIRTGCELTLSAVRIIILLQPWLGASKASKNVLNLLLLGYGADTDVLIVATTEAVPQA